MDQTKNLWFVALHKVPIQQPDSSQQAQTLSQLNKSTAIRLSTVHKKRQATTSLLT